MSGSEKNMDKIFRSKLSYFDAEPPAEVWGNINDQLNQDRRKRSIFWITRIAAGIAILTVLTLSYFLTRNALNNKMITVDESAVNQNIEESTIDLNSETEQNGVDQHAVIRDAGFLAEQPETDQISASATDAPVNGFSLPFLRGKYICQLDYLMKSTSFVPSEPGKSVEPVKNVAFPGEMTTGDLLAVNIPGEETTKGGKWGIGTQVSPLFSYRNLDIDEKSLMSQSYYNKTESGMMAYAGGINVSYDPARRISLQSGIYYSKYGLSVDNAYYYENIIPDDASSLSNMKFYSVNNSSGEIDVITNSSIGYVTNFADKSAQYAMTGETYHSNTGSAPELSDEVDNGEIIQNFEYIEIPLIVRYKLIDRKVGFNLLGGMSTNMLVGSNAYYIENGDQEKIGETTDIKPFNYSSIVGLGFSYSISEKLNISLEPTFRYYLNSINESSIIRSHPYSMGVFTGLSYSF
jgi:hypothetical protein